MRWRSVAFGLLGLLGSSAAQAATQWDVATGVDYSQGKYGAASDTDILTVPLAFRGQFDRLRLETTIPYLQVHGPGTFASGVVIGGNNAVTTRSGLGDILTGAAYTINNDGELPGLELAGSIKFPTASTSLGTGRFDYSLAANVNHNITPSVMLFGSVGYQWLSNYRSFVLENGVTALAGANFKAGDDVNLGLSANYRQAYYRTLDDQFSLTPYALWTIAPHWRVSGYGLVGLTNSTPNIGGGVRLIFFQQ